MTSEDVMEIVKNILIGILKDASGLDIELTEDQSLIDAGIIDSLSIVKLIKVLQDTFNIEIYAGDITLDNFDTIRVISNFISMRKKT